VFLFGILSSPLPYLLMAVFYFFGFATSMFKGEVETEPNTQVQVKNIQVEPQTASIEKSEYTYQFHKYNSQEKGAFCVVQPVQPKLVPINEKLTYFIQELKIPHSSISQSYFCRPPPICI